MFGGKLQKLSVNLKTPLAGELHPPDLSSPRIDEDLKRVASFRLRLAWGLKNKK